MFGTEQAVAPELSRFERIYVRLLGYPALGLRIRAKAILPLLCRLPDPEAILDAGCGRGTFTLAAARAFPTASVVGVDQSPQLAERNTRIAADLGLRNVRFLARDLTQMVACERFDAILATDVLEHVHDDRDLLRRFLHALRPGGRLLLHVPHATRHVFGRTRVNWTDIEGHVRPGYRLDELTDLLTTAGFDIESSTYNYNSIETLMNDISYAITGGHERRKRFYALCFPWLLFGSWLASRIPTRHGSGLVIVARRPPAPARAAAAAGDESDDYGWVAGQGG